MKNTIFVFILVVITTFFLVITQCDDEVSGGGRGGGGVAQWEDLSGEDGLKAVETDCDNCSYQLTGDIILTEDWVPLGTDTDPFTGTFDGGGYSVTGLSVTDTSNVGYAGMFGYIGSGGEVKNLTIINPTIGGGTAQGALAAVNEGSIIGVQVEGGTVVGTNLDTGGLVGKNYGSIANSSSSSAVSGKNNVGGLVGYNLDSASITASYSSGAVDAMNNVGGLVGNNLNGATVTNSYASGTIDAMNNVGGLVGYNLGGSIIRKSYATGVITANNNVGGLVGENSYTDEVDGVIESSHFDIGSTGKANGVGDNSLHTGVVGVSSAANIEKIGNECKDNSSDTVIFTDWAFASVWTSVASGSWPTLAWQN